MNVLLTLDNNYVEPAMILLSSLYKYHSSDIVVFLMHRNITDENIEMMRQYIDQHNSTLKVYKIEKTFLKKIPLREHIKTETAYYRLFAPYILEQDVDKILYIDPDTVVNHSLEELYNTQMQDAYFAGAPDFDRNEKYSEHKTKIGMPKERTYINSGVLLMNLDKIRENVKQDIIVQANADNIDRFQMQDQDLINAIFYDHIKVVDSKYNYDVRFQTIKDMMLWPLKYIYARNTPVIIHYMSKKPWCDEGDYASKFISKYHAYSREFPDFNNYEKVMRNKKNWWKNYQINLKTNLKRYMETKK